MNEIVQEFIVETTENLDQLDQDLVALEREPDSKPLLSSVFRTIHTVKGTSGFLGFGRLENLSHAAESLLSDLRDGRLVLTSEPTDGLLQVVDAIRSLVTAIDATGEEDDRDLSALIAHMQKLQNDEVATALTKARRSARPKLVVPPAPPGGARRSAEAKARATAAPSVKEAARESADHAREPTPGPAILVAEQPETSSAPVTTPKAPSATAAAGNTPEEPPPSNAGGAESTHEAGPGSVERSVRVDVDLLDRILRQVGELVLARNQISSHASLSDDTVLHQSVQRLSMIVSELQEGVMKTRMQPVDQLWNKIPRVVRDLAHQFGKQVRLEMEGRETELDRSLLEAVKDPLTHLVRNAIDHGLETPGQRRAAGKQETGTLSLRAYHEGGQVVLEVGDDGAGIRADKISARALERGLVTAGGLASMSEREVVDLLFLPGLSTAETVTNVSGRGVGMDVVRTNIERIGGTVDLQSTAGAGTTFRVKIPLTLAIVPALLVACHNQRYAIPQANLLELVQLRADDGGSQLERIDGATVYRLRGKLLPLVRLEDVLRLSGSASTGRPDGALHEEEQSSATTIVVIQADELLLGIVVDEVIGTEEIVVKPLGQHVKPIPVFAGATILGDGSVALILDVPGLADAAQVQEVSRTVAAAAALASFETEARAARSTFVLLRVGEERQVAVPLASVARLEEAAAGSIEQAAGRPVLQYRGELLPLVRLDEVLGEAPAAAHAANGGVPLVVYADGERHLGLVATEILDIVEGTFEVRPVGNNQAVIGSTVVNGHATDVLDVLAAIELVEGRSCVA